MTQVAVRRRAAAGSARPMHAASDTATSSPALQALLDRVAELELRVEALEASRPARRGSASSGGSSSAASSAGALDAAAWTEPYVVAQLDVAETWIEMHEVSARPQLQKLIRQVVDEEGPVTERLALDRVRRAWGLKRAGGRVQEAFEQAVRQLVARGLVVRRQDALLAPDHEVEVVRVPTEDEATRRGAEDVPVAELALALARAARTVGGAQEDDLTMQVAKVFGWTRRGGAIQERLDAAIEHAVERGLLLRAGGRIEPGGATG